MNIFPSACGHTQKSHTAHREAGAAISPGNADCPDSVARRQSQRAPSVPLLLFSFDTGLDVVNINAALRDLLGYSPEEAAAEAGWFLRRVHPDDRDRVRQALVTALAEGGSFVAQCRLLGRGGPAVHGLLQVFSVTRDGGRIAGLEGVFVDISERVRLEALLVQNEKLKTLGVISAELVHEIRNPLMAVAGFARRLRAKIAPVPELEIILTESARLERLLRRITDYLKPVCFNMSPCAINALLADCVGLLFPEMQERGVWCELALDQDIPSIMADAEVLGQVCVTLFHTALQAVGSGGVIQVRTRRSGESVLAEFRYAVPGGSMPNPQTLFLPFEEGGQGVGLPMCSRMLQNMGGGLSFAEELGDAVFTVAMPRKPGAPRPDSAVRRPAGPDAGWCFETDLPLLSRKAFEDLFRRMVRSAARHGRDFSLLLMEPENGAAPDEDGLDLLAGMLAPMLGPVQMAGRFGSGEFGVLMPGAGAAKAAKTAAIIRERLARELPPGSPGMSVGAAVCPGGGPAGPAEILETAKKALFLGRRDQARQPCVLEVRDPDGHVACMPAPAGSEGR
ncbi:MAG: PAS domain-containing protein [Thermodesulfobacteriota bacterium]